MSFGSVAKLVSAEARRRATPVVVSAALHAVLLVGLAMREARPVVLPHARPASVGADTTVTIAVPVRFVGTVYGPAVGPTSSAPFRASADESVRAKDAVAPGRTSGRRPRSKGISGLSGAAPAMVAAASALPSAPIAAPAPTDIEPVPTPSIDVRPPEPGLAPAESEVVQMPVTIARGLRVFDTFPPLPQGLARAGRKYPVDLEICVDSQGAVADVHVERNVPHQLNDVVRSAVRTWRYRPYKINGLSRPFCHPLRIVYSTG